MDARRLFLIAGVLGLGCSSLRVRTDHDASADFSQYRTFEFSGGRTLTHIGGLRLDDALVSGRVKNAVMRQLQAKGLSPATANPDLFVTFVAGARERTELDTVGSPYYSSFGWWGWGPGWWAPGYEDWWTRTYTEGTLIVDLIDARTKRLVWRAYTQAEIDNPSQAGPLVDEAISKAFRQFPPGGSQPSAYGGSGQPTRR